MKARAKALMRQDPSLELALAQIEKQFGKGAVMRLGERPVPAVRAISSGSLALDMALGTGGLPRGRITEIFGNEASGKTTIGLHAIAEAQRAGGNAAIIDAEHALDPTYAAHLGVEVDRLLISQPECGEEALEIADILVRSGAIDIFVVDSVAALVPRSEIEGEMGDSHVGLQARLMSQALRKLAGSVSRSNTAAVFINQIREKIGVMFGSPETTPGGRALKFWASVRLKARRAEAISRGQEVIGNRTVVQVVKNKLAPPFREAAFDIIYGRGISRSGELLDLGADMEIIKKSGTWFHYGEVRLGQGRENARDFLEENPSLVREIETAIRERFCLPSDRPAYRSSRLAEAEPEGEAFGERSASP